MPIVVTTDLEIIKSIMVKNFDDFINRPPMPLLMKEEDEINELPLLRGDRWRRVRRILVSGVARPKLMVGPDYRGTKEVLENLPLAAPG